MSRSTGALLVRGLTGAERRRLAERAASRRMSVTALTLEVLRGYLGGSLVPEELRARTLGEQIRTGELVFGGRDDEPEGDEAGHALGGGSDGTPGARGGAPGVAAIPATNEGGAR